MKPQARNLVSTALLLAVAGGAAALAWLGIERRDEAAATRRSADERLYAFQPAAVRAVELRAAGATTRLARAGDGWRLEAPVQAPADRAAVEGLVEAVAGLRRKAAVDAAPDAAALARYGLAAPRATVTLTLDGDRRETLALGDENPFDGTAFVRTSGGAVALVPGEVKGSLERSPFDLRDNALLHFERDQVEAVRFTSDGATFEARTKETPRLGGVLWTLSSLRARGWVEGDAARDPLDHPAREVALLGAGGKELARLRVAAERDGKLRARSTSATGLALLEPADLSTLPRSPADLAEPPAAGPARAGDAGKDK